MNVVFFVVNKKSGKPAKLKTKLFHDASIAEPPRAQSRRARPFYRHRRVVLPGLEQFDLSFAPIEKFFRAGLDQQTVQRRGNQFNVLSPPKRKRLEAMAGARGIQSTISLYCQNLAKARAGTIAGKWARLFADGYRVDQARHAAIIGCRPSWRPAFAISAIIP